MELKSVPDWPLSKPEAIALQKEAATRITFRPNTGEPELIAAVDTAYGKGGETLYAAAVVLSFPELEEVDRAYHSGSVNFPYIPGLFYYREGRVITETLAKLKSNADVVIISGHGAAHPKGCGIAGHIGLDFDLPSVGCARKLLVGSHLPVRELKGNYQPIRYRGREVGVAYRSKDNVKPIFVSPGHLCDAEFARSIVVRCIRGFRMPEPLRLAHLFANKYKRHIEKGGAPARRATSEQTG